MFIVTQKNGVKIKAKTFKEGGKFYIKIYPDSAQIKQFESLTPKYVKLEIAPNSQVISIDKIIMPDNSENETKLTPQKNSPKISEISLIERIRIYYLGNLLGIIFRVSDFIVKYSAILISIFAVGPTKGIFMFSQSSKIISRLRFIKTYHGDLLEGFLSKIGDGFQMNDNFNTKTDINQLLKNRVGEKLKFDLYQIPLYFLKTLSFRIGIYLASWTIRFLYLLIAIFIKESVCYKKFGYYHYVLHLMIFNTFILDAPFYAARTILHSKWGYNSLLWDKATSVLSICLLTYDLSYLFYVALNLQEQEILTLKPAKKSSVGIEPLSNKKQFERQIIMILGNETDIESKMNRLRVLK